MNHALIAFTETYGLAGTNRMGWWRFSVFSAAGGVVWATFYGLGAYYLGNEIERLGRVVGIGFAVVAAIATVAALIFIHRSESRLEEEAEQAFPGLLEGFAGGRSLTGRTQES